MLVAITLRQATHALVTVAIDFLAPDAPDACAECDRRSTALHRERPARRDCGGESESMNATKGLHRERRGTAVRQSIGQVASVISGALAREVVFHPYRTSCLGRQ
jgi:hypothetical protein